jgi:signal transduction histidine kinase
MTPATVAKALDPFFTTRAKGTGLGLAIVERIIRGHGGTVSIESAPGTGTTLTLTLPRAE